MTWLITVFARWGLSQRVSGVLAYVVTFALGIALLWLLCAGLIAHGKALAKRDCQVSTLQASNTALTANDKAKDQSSVERSADTAVITNEQDDRNAAINQAPPSNTGAATRVANCRVWQASHSGAVPPAACR